MKIKNKLLAACTAVLLGVGLSVSAVGAASAQEGDVAPPPAVTETEAPVAETPVVEEPQAEEVVVPTEEPTTAPEPVVEEPKVEEAPVAPAPEETTTDAQPQAPPVQALKAPASACVSHGGSDGVTPYSVTAEGLTLPAGCFFEDNGHVNIKTSVGPKNIHFESRNNQPSGQWIGKSFLPWSAFGLSGDFCVSWVQMSAFNEHFGEGGQKPLCVTKTPPFEVKEVCATWETKSVSKDWPQTILSKDCNFVPEQRCEPYKIQFDKYWIRDAADQAYFDGLTGLNSSADDQSLEPHGYYLKVIEAKDCKPVTVTVPDLPVLPPTCDADGSLPWTTNPPAQNPNGYEFPGQGFRVYLDKAYTGPGTYVATIQKIGAGFDPAFPYGTKVTGNTKQTLTVLPAIGFQSEDSSKPCYEAPTPANPVAVITGVCGAADITLTNPEVKDWAQTTASFVVNVDGKFYGAYSVSSGESETVKLAFDEDSGDHKIEVFQSGTSEWKLIEETTVPSDCIPPQPEPKVTTTEWADGEFVCGDVTVTQTRTVTTTTYVWDAETKAYVEDKVTTDTETRDRELTEQERQDVCVKPEPTNGVEKRDLDPVCVVPNNGTATVEHQERTWTQTPVWNGSDWELSDKQYGEWTTVSTTTVDSKECEVVVPPKPDTKIEFSDWVDGEFECTATEVPQTRTKTVTEYVLVDNVWVAQEPVVTTETGSRPLTEAEQEAADIECAGPQPENKVTETEWVTGEYECGDTTVQITRQVTSTEYVREGAEWVEGESVTTTQTETRDLTEAEIAELDCTVVPPTEPEEPTTPTEPEEPTTPVAPEEPTKAVTPAAVIDVLAATGANPVVQLWAFTGGALMVAFGALSMLFAARRRQLAQQGTTEV
ncbi:hypothetical protein SEA_MAGRITTE_249 [Microbacterium phage Magritte]|nr:hypothetical protein SEA_MAGRITTE_249 [Microbacterium phage Magritte]